ncbi:hypothetical protein B0H11DRAFT_2235893 [Mycena galericulata]|nr:hypothetical protein B0H11DRAFT_2235893 [Mycena galericulata]
MQLSTQTQDWIVDTLAMCAELATGSFNEVFTDPTVNLVQIQLQYWSELRNHAAQRTPKNPKLSVLNLKDRRTRRRVFSAQSALIDIFEQF